jgi:hypothetical protein
MKKLLIYILLVAPAVGLVSCYKDLGNYSYHPINEVTIGGIDTVNGYTATFGDTLTISPVLAGSLDPAGSQKYSYEWSFFDQNKGDQVISTDKNLQIRISQLPGSYTLQYKVTDLATGVLFHARTTVLVRTDVYEGYLVLNDVGGNSRLDMLSYDVVAGKFTQYTDVLKKMGSSLTPQAAPYKVVCTRTIRAFNYSDSTYGIYLLTATGTNRINSETFDWKPTYNIRYEVTGNIATDFKADNIIADPAFYFITMFMIAGNNLYARTNGLPVYNLPLNKYVGQPPFKAAPYAVGDGSGGPTILYDLDNRSFAMLASATSSSATDATAPDPGGISFPTGGDLLYMDKSAGGYGFAVTKIPNTTTCYLTKFQPGSSPVYSSQILGTDIDKATRFAVSSNPEYLFYSVGGKLYEYDLSLRSSKLMLDKGSSEITYLSFDRFTATDARHVTLYSKWGKWLSVGYYDPSGTEGSNGTLEQYSIVDANEPLIFQRSWTGFGRIASISYRER